MNQPSYRSQYSELAREEYNSKAGAGKTMVSGSSFCRTNLPLSSPHLTSTTCTLLPPTPPPPLQGPAKVPAPNPKEFTRKGHGETLRRTAAKEPEPRQFKSTKPAVPRRHEKPVMGLRSDKNYVKANAIENITAVPKKTDHLTAKVCKIAGGGYGKAGFSSSFC